MAKKSVAALTAGTVASDDTKPKAAQFDPSTPLDKLPKDVRNLIEKIRKPFVDFTADLAAINIRREELAPKFMQAFNKWQAATGGTFVDFIRKLVPDVPASRNEYRAHRAYQAADYLRRLVAQSNRQGTTAEEAGNAAKRRPVSHVTAISRLLKAFFPMLRQDARSVIYQAMHDQLNWSDDMIKRVEKSVEQEQPLVMVQEPRGLHAIGTMRVSLPVIKPSEEGEEDEGERMAAAG